MRDPCRPGIRKAWAVWPPGWWRPSGAGGPTPGAPRAERRRCGASGAGSVDGGQRGRWGASGLGAFRVGVGGHLGPVSATMDDHKNLQFASEALAGLGELVEPLFTVPVGGQVP